MGLAFFRRGNYEKIMICSHEQIFGAWSGNFHIWSSYVDCTTPMSFPYFPLAGFKFESYPVNHMLIHPTATNVSRITTETQVRYDKDNETHSCLSYHLCFRCNITFSFWNQFFFHIITAPLFLLVITFIFTFKTLYISFNISNSPLKFVYNAEP